MTLEELQKENQRFIDIYESNPKMQGSRTDLQKGKKYERGKVIMSHFTKYWSHYNKYIADQLDNIYHYIKNDSPDLFFTKVLFSHRWRPIILINFMKNGYYDMDKNNDDIIITKLYNEGKMSPNEVKKIIVNHYQQNLTLLYFLKCRSSHPQLPDCGLVKLGITIDLETRLKTLNTASPYEVYVHKVWKVKGISSEVLEKMLHKYFSSKNVKFEWFLDSDGKLLTDLLAYVDTIEGCLLEEC